MKRRWSGSHRASCCSLARPRSTRPWPATSPRWKQAQPSRPPALATLSETTRKRFAARKEKIAKAEAAERKFDVALAHDQFSWQLLSAAAGGKLDLEALTELQIAWQVAADGGAAGRRGPAAGAPLAVDDLRGRPRLAGRERAGRAGGRRSRKVGCRHRRGADRSGHEQGQPADPGQRAFMPRWPIRPTRAYTAKLLTLLSASETDEATKDLRLLGRVLLGESHRRRPQVARRAGRRRRRRRRSRGARSPSPAARPAAQPGTSSAPMRASCSASNPCPAKSSFWSTGCLTSSRSKRRRPKVD